MKPIVKCGINKARWNCTDCNQLAESFNLKDYFENNFKIENIKDYLIKKIRTLKYF